MREESLRVYCKGGTQCVRMDLRCMKIGRKKELNEEKFERCGRRISDV